MTGDVGVEAAVAVGHDVEPGDFLVAQVGGDGVEVLLAVGALDHRLAEFAPAEVLGVPAGARQRADDGGRQHDPRSRDVHR
ncbi:MAG: hypothetical protein K0R40_2921 [Burkholderiales bacterium]|nr:hypothetical protein [Burkholderiales bacterium]